MIFYPQTQLDYSCGIHVHLQVPRLCSQHLTIKGSQVMTQNNLCLRLKVLLSIGVKKKVGGPTGGIFHDICQLLCENMHAILEVTLIFPKENTLLCLF